MTSRDSVLGGLRDPGGPLPGGSVEARWVNLRWRRIPTWSAVTTVSVALAVSIPIRLATEIGKPYIGGSEITGGVVFLVGSVAVAMWMVRVAPRVFTRQGVAADAIGVALIQEPSLWFRGGTVRIPWDVIRSISEREVVTGRPDNPRKNRIVSLAVDTEDRAIAVPSWASAVPRGGLRVDVRPGNSRQPKVLEAFRAVRPDLVA